MPHCAQKLDLTIVNRMHLRDAIHFTNKTKNTIDEIQKTSTYTKKGKFTDLFRCKRVN